MMGPLRTWLVRLFQDEFWQTESTAEERRAFARYAHDFNYRFYQVLTILQGCAFLLWWPYDQWISSRPVAGGWGLGGFFGALGLYCFASVLFAAWPKARVHLFALMLLNTCLNCAFLGWVVAQLQLVEGWPYGGQPMPMIAIPLLLSLPRRILLTLLLAGIYPLAFALSATQPVATGHLLLYMGLTTSPVIFGVAFGHGYLAMTRNRFLQERRLRAANARLDQVNRALVEQVDQKTRSLESLANQAEQVREGERASLAQELHDELGQLLTGMRFELELAQMLSDEEQQHDLSAHLAGLDSLLGQITQNVRDVLTMMRPKIVEQSGFLPALMWLVKTLQKRYPMEISTELPAEPPAFGEDEAIALFRILQESLTNAIKHAEASRVQIGLRRLDDQWLLQIQDDGIGCPPDQLYHSKGLGLMGMVERARALGGSLELSNPPEGGTRVRVWIPDTLE